MKIIFEDLKHLKDDMQSGRGTRVDNQQIPATFAPKMSGDGKRESIEEMNCHMRDPDYQW